MMKFLIAGSAAAGLLALATPAQAARIVFTAPSSQAFTASNTTTGQGNLNAGVQISTTGGTGVFNGATGWTAASGASNIQPMAWRIPATSPSTSVGGSRIADVRFNQFTLTGTCSICGQLLVPSSNGFNLGGIYPAQATIGNTGVTNGATIRAGALYGGPAITFAIPNSGQTGSVSFESISGGGYTITLDTPDVVPAPLPLLGGASAFAFSRRLRRRIRQAQAA